MLAYDIGCTGMDLDDIGCVDVPMELDSVDWQGPGVIFNTHNDSSEHIMELDSMTVEIGKGANAKCDLGWTPGLDTKGFLRHGQMFHEQVHILLANRHLRLSAAPHRKKAFETISIPPVGPAPPP